MLALPFRLIGALLRLLFLPLALVRRANAAPPGAYIELELGARLNLVPRPPSLFDWLRSPTMSHWTFDRLVSASAADSRVKGILLRLKSPQMGMAAVDAWRATIHRARAAGLDVVVYAEEGLSTRDAMLASAAGRILLSPTGPVHVLGFAFPSRFFKKTLERFGIGVDVLAKGRYKSAGSIVAASEMSDAEREQLDAILDHFYDDLLGALAEGRKVDRDRAKEWVDAGPLSAKRAHELGLVDGVVHSRDVAEWIGSEGQPVRLVSAWRYLARRQRRPWPGLRRPPAVACIRVQGAIGTTQHGGSAVAHEADIVKSIERVERDRRMRALVLYVDSPGGSVVASDAIADAVRRCGAHKPVVACMGNVAASGGYYVSAVAHRIVSHANTLTGSIGVVMGRPHVSALFERYEVGAETLKRGKHASLLDPVPALSEADREALEREIGDAYDVFVDVVSRGRNMDRERVLAAAEGRVWVGRDALRVGLVDELGTFRDACARAAEHAGLRFSEDAVELLSTRPRGPSGWRVRALAYVIDRLFAKAGVALEQRLGAIGTVFGRRAPDRPMGAGAGALGELAPLLGDGRPTWISVAADFLSRF